MSAKKCAIKRKICMLLVSFVLLSQLSSCYYPIYENSVRKNGREDLLILFTHSIPFVADLDNDMTGSVEIYPVEADKYGRTLGILQFNKKVSNCLLGENAVYCVLQSGSKKESCFYEDVCCIMVENGADPSAAIEQLKQDNDWNRPLATDKCRTIPIKYYTASGDFDTQYGYTDYRTPACNAVGWPADSAWLEVLSKDGCGLWLFTLLRDKNDTDSPVCMIMMKEDASSDPKLSVIGTRLLANRSAPWVEIHAFKEEMGWQFAYRTVTSTGAS